MVPARKKSKALKPKGTSKAKPVRIKANSDGVMFATLDSIEVENGFNVRSNCMPDPELIASVKEHGVIHPVHVRWKDRKKSCLYLIDGERRFLAAREVGQGSVPIVQHGFIGDKEAYIISLTANENQKRLTRKEMLEGFRRLKAQGLTVAQVARVMGVDSRTVDEAVRVDSKGAKELKAASKKGSKKGGVAPRAAARASNLPKEEQKKLVKRMSGKPMEDQLEEVRKVEKRLGLTRPGRKKEELETAKPKGPKPPKGYRLAEDLAARCKALEETLTKKLTHAPSHRVYTGQMMIIKCLRGHCEVADVFGWKNV